MRVYIWCDGSAMPNGGPAGAGYVVVGGVHLLGSEPLGDATKFPIGTEVVVIYYQGGIWIDDGKAVLQLRRGAERNHKDVISFQELSNSFAGTRGATLCLLDVNGDAQVAMAQPWTEKDSRTGLLSFMWLEPPEGRSPEISNDTRLVKVLGDVIDGTSTLKQAEEKVSQEASRIGLREPHFRYNQNVPEFWSGLVFGDP